MRYYILILISVFFLQCKKKEVKTAKDEIETGAQTSPTVILSKADSIVNKAIEAHGGKYFEKAEYSFVFRGKKYTFKNNDANYTYQVESTTKEGVEIIDKIENGVFERKINQKLVTLSEKQIDAYSNALNSVIYFTLLPYKLNDASVNKNFIGTTSIKNMDYFIIEVNFNKEGGGKDFDDEFYYWIHKETFTVDYFAYKYNTNGGGVRFRSFYNRKKVGNLIFQDYINWKAENSTPLNSLPKLFEAKKLQKLSLIENTLIHNL